MINILMASNNAKTQSNNNSLINIYKFDKDKYNNLLRRMETITKNDEFEVSINYRNGITYSQYYDVINYLIARADFEKKPNNLKREVSLDISYKYDQTNSQYRITIIGEDRINSIMGGLSIRKSHGIFSILMNNILEKTSDDEKKTLFAINKIKNYHDNIEDVDNDICYRLSQELPIPQSKMSELTKLSETEIKKINFRFKDRLSYTVEYNDFAIRIDMTEVKRGMTVNKLDSAAKSYELELEYVGNTSKTNSTIKMDRFFSEIYYAHQVLQKSNIILRAKEKNSVMEKLNMLLYKSKETNAKDLPGMQSQNLENQHVDNLPTNYSVTDKADGERYFLLIMDGRIFLISNNLNVKELDSSKYPNLSKYNNTVLDGEYIWLSGKNKFLYLAFDLIILKEVDIREEVNLSTRLTKLNDVLINGFGVKTVSKLTLNNENVELKQLVQSHSVVVKEMFKEMNAKLNASDVVIMGKIFIVPTGLFQSEIWAYSEMMWKSYTLDNTVNCPYVLDGLIYTPLQQKYTKNIQETVNKIYKWKPEKMNSIDFYVKFEKNMDTQQILNVYDNSSGKNIDDALETMNVDEKKNSIEETIELENSQDYMVGNKVYRICNLYVGSTKTGNETPTLFGKEDNLYLAYLYVEDGEVRDVEGNIIQDGTVVEFAYNMNPRIEHPYRWVPLRTRFDKTESVLKYQRKYGNNEWSANKIWRSIMIPFEFSDISSLANPETFESHMNAIKVRITKDVIIEERKENIYFAKRTNLSRNMGDYHNFIKSNIIYTICGEKTAFNGITKKLNVIDVGIGRGSDLMKYYHAKVESIVAFDIDPHGIYSATDSVTSLYKSYKRKMPNFPKATFFVGDAGSQFDLASQEKTLGNISDINRETVKKLFGNVPTDTNVSKYDVFSCQFMLHYMFKNDQTLNNFCYNVNKYLNDYGYILITTIDGKILDGQFDNGKVTQYYTQDGNKKILFEFTKRYTDTNLAQTGLAIDFYNASFMLENTVQTEYIVDPDFLIHKMETICNMMLVETDTFENQFNIQRHFFENISSHEAHEKTKAYLTRIKEFYNFDDDGNKTSFELTKLNRFFIFQKLPRNMLKME